MHRSLQAHPLHRAADGLARRSVWWGGVAACCGNGLFFGRRACRSLRRTAPSSVGVKIHGEGVSIDQRCCLSSLLSVAHRFCLSSLLSSILSFSFMASHHDYSPSLCYFCVATCIAFCHGPTPLTLPSTHLPICARTPPPYIPQPRSPSPTQIPHHHLQPPQSSSWRGLRWKT